MRWHSGHSALALFCMGLFLFLRPKPKADRYLVRDNDVLWKEKQHLDAKLRENASSIVVCLLVSSNNISLDQTIRILNHAYIPSGVELHLSIVSSLPVAIRKDAWHRGNCTVFRNVSLIRFRKDLCFILIQDTMDVGPYFLYWAWRSWIQHHAGPTLISGDAQGTGLIPNHEIWVRFVRGERALGNTNASRRYFDYFNRNVPGARVLYPPILNGYCVIRPERQSMTEPEREPRLTRVWDERFSTQVILKSDL